MIEQFMDLLDKKTLDEEASLDTKIAKEIKDEMPYISIFRAGVEEYKKKRAEDPNTTKEEYARSGFQGFRGECIMRVGDSELDKHG